MAEIMKAVLQAVKPGVEAVRLNNLAYEMAIEKGDKPAFLNYKPYSAKRPYPASLCVSVNDEIVHGIPNEGGKILKEGDIVSLDMGLVHKGLITDMAVTVPVGRLTNLNRNSLMFVESLCIRVLRRSMAEIISGILVLPLKDTFDRLVTE